jgi:hypothetical protein
MLGVGHSQVVTDNLEVGGLVEVAPDLPTVLGKGVLNGDNGVLLGKRLVEVGKLLMGEQLAEVGVWALEVKWYLPSL